MTTLQQAAISLTQALAQFIQALTDGEVMGTATLRAVTAPPTSPVDLQFWLEISGTTRRVIAFKMNDGGTIRTIHSIEMKTP